jgi:lipid-binding SYLF domain-containing protein
MDGFLQNSVVKSLLPVPKDVAGECKRAAKYLNKVSETDEIKHMTSVVSESAASKIPASIIANAKGIAVFKVLKGGFIWSGRIGSGMAVSKLPDGTWSAPAVYGMFGVGVGGQIGGQQIYLVLIINNEKGMAAFKTPGNVTLGADVGVAVGPLGREGSVAGAVVGMTPIYSYSKTVGLFAGISLEGTVMFERRDANSKFYGKGVTAKDILNGKAPPPPEAQILYNAIEALSKGTILPLGGDSDDESVVSGTIPRPGQPSNYSSTVYQPSADAYQPPPGNPPLSAFSATASTTVPATGPKPKRANDSELQSPFDELPSYSPPSTALPPTDVKKKPPPPIPKKPSSLKKHMVVALYDFEAQQDTDLTLVKGESYEVLDKTPSSDGWWRGKDASGKEGIVSV